MKLRPMRNSQSNKEKLFINNGKNSLTDDMSDAPVQSGDKIQKHSTITHHAVSADVTGSTDFHLVHSPSRSARRSYSNTSDGDQFQIVTYKKSKQLKNHGDNNINHYQVHIPQDTDIENDNINMIMNGNVNNVPNSSLNLHDTLPNQQHLITSASTRYALTRFPFPPHVVRFNVNKIVISKFKEVIIHHFQSNYDINIEIANCRISSLKCSNNEIDVLLFVKDPTSFAFLLDHTKWPERICDEKFKFPSVPSIPPQLSLIIKNVDLKLNFDDFSNEIKNLYPDVRNVIRMKNKFGHIIKLVKLELTSPKTRNDLLKNKKIFINYICYDVDEYLAPVNVLICSKCCAIGHFRRQCPEQNETCKSCGETHKDLKAHQCSSIIKCIHCNGDHLSNSMKCPIVKSFRDALTKNLMNNKNDNPSFPSSSSTNTTTNNNKFHHTTTDFPRLLAPWSTSGNSLDSKLNVLLSGLTQANETLSKLCESNKHFQQFIIEKNERDQKIIKELDNIKSSNSSMEADLLLLKEKYQDFDKSMKTQDVMFKQFLFPMLDDILKFIGEMNVGAGGRTLDADLKSNFERFRTQMSNATAETGKIDLAFYGQAFSNFKFFFQSGENRNGGVLILIRNNIQVKRVDCKIPNVCIIDLKVEDEFRIIGVYAPESRSWNWHDLSSFISVNCAIFGDFNVDLEHDDKKAESLLEWADSLNLSPFLPDYPTSLRSDRTIDYAFSNIAKIDIQKFDTNTTSDHYPILSIIPMECKQQVKGKSIHWKVFNLFTEYTFSYWEKIWCNQHLNSTYDEYIKFLHLLTARKTEALWSTRAPRSAPFDIETGGNEINWTKEFKYLGYFITPRLGWGKLIH
ncbi:unnamed protein product, partial [Rotaria sp. Silwood1]